MSDNLLRNPGCEEGAHQQTRYWEQGEGPWTTLFDNIWPPIGWTAWWIDRRVNEGSPQDQKTGRPEFHTLSMPPFPDPVRLRSGQKFAKLHTFFRTHYAGWLQEVSVTAGHAYRFSIYAHSWYSDCSYKPHTGPLLDDCNRPASDSHDILQVGIGPSGPDRSPLDADIVWSAPTEIYGSYKDALAVEAVAGGETLTVWLRSQTNYALQHQDVYFDDASLVEIAAPQPSREYSRTYVLWPDGAGAAEQQRITALNPGRTCGPSADDAAIDHRFLTDATIICYQPQTWPGGKAGLEAFWRTYYDFPAPQDAIIYREDDEPPPPNPILLWQRDPEWKDIGFGDANCHSTIGQQGCFITDLAMAQRFYGIKDDATPLSVDEALGPAGYNGCVANWVGNNGHFERQLQISISRGTDGEAALHMDEGGCAMAELEPASYEHFVLVYERDDVYWALDPWTNTETKLEHWDDTVQSWRILTLVEEPPPPGPQPARIGIHLQSQDGDWLAYARNTKGPMKFLNHWTELLQSKRAATPLPIYRHWVQEQPLDVPDKDALMRDYINRFRDDMTNVCNILTQEGFTPPFFGVEGFNETYACWADSLPDAIECDRAFVRQLALTGLPVVPVPFCAAVGNPQLPSEDPNGPTWPHILQLARETEAQGGYFGYHTYWFANPNESGLVDHWPWLAGRWTLFDDYLKANGVRVGWFFGECGAVGGHAWPNGGYNLLPQDGWLASTCYQGNWQRYEADLIRFNDMVTAWNTTHGNRALGGTIFTTGGWDWEKFLIRGPEMTAIANALQLP